MSIVIVDYDPDWPARFDEERARLAAACPLIVAVEHIGSTAVPGLAAKPVIDIMPGVRSLADAVASIEAIITLGYEYVPAFEDALPDRRYFRRTVDGVRTHQLHVVEVSGEFWKRHLLFRDYLRTHPETARDYEQLKRRLAPRFNDTNDYALAKTDFIRAVEERARQELRR